MRDSEGGRLLAANLLVAVSAALSAVLPGALLEGFSVLGTHRSWMAACAAAVGTASAALSLALRPGQPHKRSNFAYKLYLHITCLGESFCAFLILGNALLFVVPAICVVAEDGKIGWAQNSFPSPGLAGIESEMVKETLAHYNLNKVGQFNKISRFLKCCIYFFMSCILFHAIIVLYGAPLIESVTETFLFAVLLSTFTTLQCLCILGPNIQAWIRVFSKNGAMSIWESSLQITTVCSILGAWFGAFPIPLDWDRPWQVWPISCSLGATFGYMAGLIIAPLWIHWNRKQLTYKSR